MSEPCINCGNKKMTKSRVTYKYDESGLDDVTLKNVPQFKCTECGEVYTELPNIIQLHQMIAEHIAENQPAPLLGKHVRFIRQYLGHSTDDYAKILGINAKTLSRIENGKQKHSPGMDNTIRMHVFIKAPNRDYEDMVETITHPPTKPMRKLVFDISGSQYALA